MVISDVLDDPHVGEGGIAEAAGEIEGREDVAEGDGVGGGVCKGECESGRRRVPVAWDDDG